MGNPNLDICHLICFIYNLSHIWEIPDTSCRLRVITVLLYFCSLQECHYYNLEIKFIQGNSCSRFFFAIPLSFFYGACPAFLLHFRKMQMRKAKGGVAWYAVEQWKPICSFASCFCTEICIEWNRDFHLQNWIPTVIQNIPSETVQQMKKYFEKACFPLVTSANSYVAPVKSQILGSRHISSLRYIHVSWILYNIFIYDYLCHHDYHRHQLVQVLGSC